MMIREANKAMSQFIRENWDLLSFFCYHGDDDVNESDVRSSVRKMKTRKVKSHRESKIS